MFKRLKTWWMTKATRLKDGEKNVTTNDDLKTRWSEKPSLLNRDQKPTQRQRQLTRVSDYSTTTSFKEQSTGSLSSPTPPTAESAPKSQESAPAEMDFNQLVRQRLRSPFEKMEGCDECKQTGVITTASVGSAFMTDKNGDKVATNMPRVQSTPCSCPKGRALSRGLEE